MRPSTSIDPTASFYRTTSLTANHTATDSESGTMFYKGADGLTLTLPAQVSAETNGICFGVTVPDGYITVSPGDGTITFDGEPTGNLIKIPRGVYWFVQVNVTKWQVFTNSNDMKHSVEDGYYSREARCTQADTDTIGTVLDFYWDSPMTEDNTLIEGDIYYADVLIVGISEGLAAGLSSFEVWKGEIIMYANSAGLGRNLGGAFVQTLYKGTSALTSMGTPSMRESSVSADSRVQFELEVVAERNVNWRAVIIGVKSSGDSISS